MKYLGNLRAEITVIGQGDMEHRVTVKGHDENFRPGCRTGQHETDAEKQYGKMSGKFTGTIRS